MNEDDEKLVYYFPPILRYFLPIHVQVIISLRQLKSKNELWKQQ